MRYHSRVTSLRGETAQASPPRRQIRRHRTMRDLSVSQTVHEKKKRKKTQTTSTGRHAAAPLSHIFSQILRNPQTCSIDQIRMTPPQVTRERLGCSFDRQKTLSYNLFNQPFISVLLPSPTLSVSPLLSPSDDVNASGTDGCREHLITLTPCLCNRTQTRHTNTHTHTHIHSESKMLMKISSIIKVST